MGGTTPPTPPQPDEGTTAETKAVARKGRRRRRRERRGKITELMTLTTTPSVLSGVFLSSLVLVASRRQSFFRSCSFFLTPRWKEKAVFSRTVSLYSPSFSPPASSGVPSCVVAGFRVVKQEQKNPGYGGLGFCLVDVGKFTCTLSL